ncbi:hypothetical protein MPSEU_000247100 [Mayamaea pseudoterrestris]|nr:hypothetical protein MPSEU_000247100 [Mayamaea pseudoterrestris]
MAESIATTTDSTSLTVKKRCAEETNEATLESDNNSSDNNNKKACTSPRVFIDRAVEIGLKPGDRIEVQWQIGSNDDDDDDDDDEATEQHEEQDNDETTTTSRWWPATLLEHDGKSGIALDEADTSKDPVAIRFLEYDAHPEGGFPEKSQESVVFLGNYIVDVESHERLLYRKFGEETSEEPVISLTSNEVEDYMNNLMASLLEKHSDQFKKLSPAQQAFVAEGISSNKSKFVDLLLQNGKAGVVTAEKIQELLAKVWSE